MDRRWFVTGLPLAMLAAPFSAGAQSAAPAPRIGVLAVTPTAPGLEEAFMEGLRELHRGEVAVVRRDVGGVPDRLPGVAAGLARAGVRAVLAGGPEALAAMAAATKTIPVVAVDLESDPLAMGYAKTLARPGANVTGVFLDLPELSAKQLQLFRQIAPTLSRVGLVGDPVMNAAQFRATERAARALGVQLQTFEGRTIMELEAALEGARRAHVGAVVIFSSPIVFTSGTRIAAAAIGKRLPAVSLFTEFANAGGLLTYGPSLRECFRRCGVYVAKILNGAKPGDLPIERPERFELAINMKTAQALGLTIPPALRLQAGHLVE